MTYLRFCIPSEIREQVLSALLEDQKERSTTAKPFKLGRLDPEKYHAKKEALSLMIQVMTRSITTNISKVAGPTSAQFFNFGGFQQGRSSRLGRRRQRHSRH